MSSHEIYWDHTRSTDLTWFWHLPFFIWLLTFYIWHLIFYFWHCRLDNGHLLSETWHLTSWILDICYLIFDMWHFIQHDMTDGSVVICNKKREWLNNIDCRNAGTSEKDRPPAVFSPIFLRYWPSWCSHSPPKIRCQSRWESGKIF